jgi:hypothetical protein
MAKDLLSKIFNGGGESTYYDCEDIAHSYLDFGVPKKLAVQWICAKLNVSEEISERACDYVYYHSKD